MATSKAESGHDLSACRGKGDRISGKVSGCRLDKVAHRLDLETA